MNVPARMVTIILRFFANDKEVIAVNAFLDANTIGEE